MSDQFAANALAAKIVTNVDVLVHHRTPFLSATKILAIVGSVATVKIQFVRFDANLFFNRAIENFSASKIMALPVELKQLIFSYITNIDIIQRLFASTQLRRLLQHSVVTISSPHPMFDFENIPFLIQFNRLQRIDLTLSVGSVSQLIDLARLPQLMKCHINISKIATINNMTDREQIFWSEYLSGHRVDCRTDLLIPTQRTIRKVDITISMDHLSMDVTRNTINSVPKLYETFAAAHSLFGILVRYNFTSEIRNLLQSAPEFYKIMLPNVDVPATEDRYQIQVVAEVLNILQTCRIRVIIDDEWQRSLPNANWVLLKLFANSGSTHIQYLQKMKASIPFSTAEEVLTWFPNLTTLVTQMADYSFDKIIHLVSRYPIRLTVFLTEMDATELPEEELAALAARRVKIF